MGMWRMENSVSDRAGKRGVLEEGHRIKSRLKGLNKKPGLRKYQYPQDPNGMQPQGTRKPGDIAGSTKCNLPSISRKHGSSGVAWGLLHGMCSQNV